MIKIKPISDTHQYVYFDLSQRNTERLRDFFPITIEKTETAAKTLDSIKLYKMLQRSNDLHILMIEHGDDDMAVGFIILKNIDKKVGKCELVYFIDKDNERKGFATAGVEQVKLLAFGTFGINKIYCRVATDDIAGNRVAEKCGFTLEGVLKQEFRLHDGRLTDLNYYGLLKENNN